MRSTKNDSGWILVAVALFLVVLCGFVALATDVGSFYSVRTSAQRAADAGALAGALTFVTSCQNCAANDPNREKIAKAHAEGVALANKIMNVAVQKATATVNVAARQVTVKVTQSAPTFFAGVLGFGPVTISATATAEAGKNATASNCVKPLFIPNSLEIVGNPCAACGSTTNPSILVNGSGQVTSFGTNAIPSSFGFNMKSATDPLTQPVNNIKSMYGIKFDNDTQSANPQYGLDISTCTDSAKIVCNDSYLVKSDTSTNLNTTAKQELTILANSNGTPDIWSGTGLYTGASGSISNTSHQSITVPIFDVCSIPSFCALAGSPPQPQAMLSSPTQKIKVVGFARLFVVPLSGGNIKFVLDGVSGCSNYVPTPGSDPTGPYGIPVRLVHN